MRVSQVSIVRQASRRAARQCGPAASIAAPLNGTSVRFFNASGGEPEEDDTFRKYTHKLKKFEPPLKTGKRGIDLVRAMQSGLDIMVSSGYRETGVRSDISLLAWLCRSMTRCTTKERASISSSAIALVRVAIVCCLSRT